MQACRRPSSKLQHSQWHARDGRHAGGSCTSGSFPVHIWLPQPRPHTPTSSASAHSGQPARWLQPPQPHRGLRRGIPRPLHFLTTHHRHFPRYHARPRPRPRSPCWRRSRRLNTHPHSTLLALLVRSGPLRTWRGSCSRSRHCLACCAARPVPPSAAGQRVAFTAVVPNSERTAQRNLLARHLHKATGRAAVNLPMPLSRTAPISSPRYHRYLQQAGGACNRRPWQAQRLPAPALLCSCWHPWGNAPPSITRGATSTTPTGSYDVAAAAAAAVVGNLMEQITCYC